MTKIKKIDKRKEQILAYLQQNPDGAMPKQIGLSIGLSIEAASATVCPILKTLIKEGIVLKKKSRPIYFLNPEVVVW